MPNAGRKFARLSKLQWEMSETVETTEEQTSEPRLLEQYRQRIVPEMQRRLDLENLLAVPRVDKIVLNVGVGRATEDKKHLDEAFGVLKVIGGQQPVITRARKSVAGFHLRENTPIGCKVTIRGRRMYEFLDRLISVVIPRIRDFRGLSQESLDGQGNLTIGIEEHIVFPEVNLDEISSVFGMNITICTTAGTDQQAFELLSLLGMPFRR